MIVVFYASEKPQKNTTKIMIGTKPLWIRGEKSNEELNYSIDRAKPHRDEMILNAIEIKDK